MFEDKVLVCKDCGQEFTFTAGEQEFYAEKRVLTTHPLAAKRAEGTASPQPAASPAA